MTKRLALKKDTLGELSLDDLRLVAGGQDLEVPPTTWIVSTLPLRWCLSTLTTGA